MLSGHRRLPIRLHAVVAMGHRFPISVGPGVIAELWRILELLFRNAGAEPTEGRIILQSRPRYRIVAVTEPEETAEAHHGVDDPT